MKSSILLYDLRNENKTNSKKKLKQKFKFQLF